MPALGAQQADMDKADELPRGMARLPRYMVEDAGLRRHARSGRGQRQRGWQTWSKNLLDNLPDSFNEAQLEALRISLGKTKEGTKNQIYKWIFRGFITHSAQTGLYTKTKEYLGVAN